MTLFEVRGFVRSAEYQTLVEADSEQEVRRIIEDDYEGDWSSVLVEEA